jgi:hypothetical protein
MCESVGEICTVKIPIKLYKTLTDKTIRVSYRYIENMFILPILKISFEYHRLFGISNV